MTENKSRIGKGLAALLGDKQNFSIINKDNKNINYLEINIELIDTNPDQPRKKFNEEEINNLSSSIKEFGVLQPIVLKPINERYIIIAGERRFLASKQAGLRTIPAVIKDNNDEKTDFIISVIENIQRSDLNAIEEANAFKMLIEKYNCTQTELSEKIGKSRVYITNSLRLLNLPNVIQQHLINGDIEAGHARALINCPFAAEIIDHIIDNKMSVREVEQMVRNEKQYMKPLQKAMKKIAKRDFDDFEKKLGNNCKISYNERTKKYHLAMDFEDFDNLEDFVNSVR